jgi:hypothetical protein
MRTAATSGVGATDGSSSGRSPGYARFGESSYVTNVAPICDVAFLHVACALIAMRTVSALYELTGAMPTQGL